MRSRSRIATLAAATLTTALPTTATFAHVAITASTPAEGVKIAQPRAVSLTFSEAMSPSAVATTIVMTGMPGMADHPPMTIRNFQSSWSNENRTITMTLRQPLVPGTYDLRWQAAGADGHRVIGKISFSVG